MVEVTIKSPEKTGSRRTSVCVEDLFAVKIEQSESRKPSLLSKENGELFLVKLMYKQV